MASTDNTSKTWTQRGLRLLPWFVSIACLLYIFTTTEVGPLWEALQTANMPLFWGSVLGIFIFIVFPVDSFVITRLLNWFEAPVTLREIMPIRGTSYLLGIFNYSAGSAGVSLYLRRTHGVPALRSLGALFFMTLCDVSTLALMVMIGAGVLGDMATSARIVSGCVLLILAGTLVYWRAGFDFFVLGHLRDRSLFAAFKQAKIRHYGLMILMRAPLTFLYTVLQYLTLESFGIHIPFYVLLVYVPIQMLVAGLPISVAGIGTVQVVQRTLYAPYADLATIDAFAVLLVFGFLCPRMIIGLAYTARASRDLERGLVNGSDGDDSREVEK